MAFEIQQKVTITGGSGPLNAAADIPGGRLYTSEDAPSTDFRIVALPGLAASGPFPSGNGSEGGIEVDAAGAFAYVCNDNSEIEKYSLPDFTLQATSVSPLSGGVAKASYFDKIGGKIYYVTATTIARFDVATMDFDDEYVIPGVSDQTTEGGLIKIGNFLYVSRSGPGTIKKIDTTNFSGGIVGSLAVPDNNIRYFSGTATHLFYAGGNGRLVRVNLVNFVVEDFLALPDGAYLFQAGFVSSDGHLYYGNYAQSVDISQIFKVDIATFTIKKSIIGNTSPELGFRMIRGFVDDSFARGYFLGYDSNSDIVVVQIGTEAGNETKRAISDSVWIAGRQDADPNVPKFVKFNKTTFAKLVVEGAPEAGGLIKNIAVDPDFVWGLSVAKTLYKIDRQTDEIVYSTPNVGASTFGAIAADKDFVWVALSTGLQKIDRVTNSLLGSPLNLSSDAADVKVDNNFVWVLASSGANLFKVDRITNMPVATYPLADLAEAYGIHVDELYVWVLAESDSLGTQRLLQIEKSTGNELQNFEVDTDPSLDSYLVGNNSFIWIGFGDNIFRFNKRNFVFESILAEDIDTPPPQSIFADFAMAYPIFNGDSSNSTIGRVSNDGFPTPTIVAGTTVIGMQVLVLRGDGTGIDYDMFFMDLQQPQPTANCGMLFAPGGGQQQYVGGWSGTVQRLDKYTLNNERILEVEQDTTTVVLDNYFAWASDYDGNIFKLDKATGRLLKRVTILPDNSNNVIQVDDQFLWRFDQNNLLLKIDKTTLAVLDTFPVPNANPGDWILDADYAWFIRSDVSNGFKRVLKSDGTVTDAINQPPNEFTSGVFTDGDFLYVWGSVGPGAYIRKYDRLTLLSVLQLWTDPGANVPSKVVSDTTYLWLGSNILNGLMRLDKLTGDPLNYTLADGAGAGLAVDDVNVWVGASGGGGNFFRAAKAADYVFQFNSPESNWIGYGDSTGYAFDLEFPFVPPPFVPVAPSNLRVMVFSSTALDLSWDDNSVNEDGFKIERSIDGLAWAEIDQVGPDVIVYQDTGLLEGVRYYYQVRAFNGNGDSAYSNTEFSRTLGPVQPFAFVTSHPSMVGGSGNQFGVYSSTYDMLIQCVSQSPGDVVSIPMNDMANQTLVFDQVFGIQDAAVDEGNSKIYFSEPGLLRRYDLPGFDNLVDLSGSLPIFGAVVGVDNERDYLYCSQGDLTVRMNLTTQVFDPSQIDFTTEGFTNFVGMRILVDAERGFAFIFTSDGATAVFGKIDLNTWTKVGVLTLPVSTSGVNAGQLAIDLDRGFIYLSTEALVIKIDCVGFTVAAQTNFDPPDVPGKYSALALDSRNGNIYACSAEDTSPTVPPARTSKINLGSFLEVAFHVPVGDFTGGRGGAFSQGTGKAALVMLNLPGGGDILEYTVAVAPPIAPTNLQLTVVSSSRIDLQWDDNSLDEVVFKIERSPNGVTLWTQIDTTLADVNTYQSTGLSASTTYYYRVRASSAGGDSAYTNVANATTMAGGGAPSAPTGLGITVLTSSSLRLDWTDTSSNEDGFKIEASRTGVTFTQIATVGVGIDQYIHLALGALTQYYYRVRAYNGNGDSAYTNIASGTTLAPAVDSTVRIYADEPDAQGAGLPEDRVEVLFAAKEVLRDTGAKLLNNRRADVQFDFLDFMSSLDERINEGQTSEGVYLSPSLVSFILLQRDRAVTYYNLNTPEGDYEAGLLLISISGILE